MPGDWSLYRKKFAGPNKVVVGTASNENEAINIAKKINARTIRENREARLKAKMRPITLPSLETLKKLLEED